MRYLGFRIQNFKGIRDADIRLLRKDNTPASVFAFVGLNESGKTTILEAIHSFAPDPPTSKLVGGDDSEGGVPIESRVPRHIISNFTGKISITATVALSATDIIEIREELEENNIIVDEIPRKMNIERYQQFENGTYKGSRRVLTPNLRVRSKKQRAFRNPTIEEGRVILNSVYGLTPDIAYFPTFVFNFPKEIFLTRNDLGAVNEFYKSVFQDILDFDGKGHTIKESIVERIRRDELKIPWSSFLPAWITDPEKPKIQQVIDRASAAVTRAVLGRWEEIFGESAGQKEIRISLDVSEGEEKDVSGAIRKTDLHNLYVSFEIKDGSKRFDVRDRSLGFRWFFAFLLFTQFRVARKESRPVLFLFDEPASNLHAAAQKKLIESFPQIAKNEHMMIYTTHSHYMIEPRWLEQTFIVTNRADAPPNSVLDAASLDDESLDIKATRYAQFAESYPNSVSYFQPILDRLQVVPSRFDVKKTSVVVEGKSDYYILCYCARMIGNFDIHIIPARGATTIESLLSLDIGWNLKMLFILDGDGKGQSSAEKYKTEYMLPDGKIIFISDLIPGSRKIEGLFDTAAISKIAAEAMIDSVNKKDILRFFQERVASDSIVDLGDVFRGTASELLSGISARLAALAE